ncbi:hypothetical protein GCM10010193_12340 [Kitasatospora atroaurantiaca]|uniref:Uncharacterized protein n=1 Tax=Kitasatospora atroaurantiaca TaxID=285545 RepID=A0A561EQN1_9ACTN|nr:hypothetical protein FB465_2967 [Kitasatospora atroaurantiaca]
MTPVKVIWRPSKQLTPEESARLLRLLFVPQVEQSNQLKRDRMKRQIRD